MPVILFRVRSVNPVKNVQSSVGSHEKDIISGKVLDFTVALQNDQLRHDCDTFKKDRKCPQEFHYIEICDTGPDQVNQESYHGTWNCSKFPMQEGILALFVGTLDRFLEFDSVNNRGCSSNIYKFHDRVIDRIKSREEIQVPGHKNKQIEFMRLDGYTLGIFRNS